MGAGRFSGEYGARRTAVPSWLDMGRSAPFSPGLLHSWDEMTMSAARVVLPLVFSLQRPASVVDVGCLYGSWAAACAELGVEDVVGIDGDYIDRSTLRISERRFIVHDLATPLELPRSFDLAISLEVAHYLPECRASGFVDDLCALAPLVLFSSANPNPGGTSRLNGQWPAYWVERFANHGYTPVDCIRDEVWDHPAVGRWYAETTLLFASRDAQSPAIRGHYGFGRSPARVHPEKYLVYADGRYHRLRARATDLITELALMRPGRSH